MIYKLRGYEMTFKKLPKEIGVIIFSYLTKRELLTKMNRVSKQTREITQDPTLWKKISIYAS